MFGAHWYQLVVVLGVAVLFFGPKRLPEMGSSIGKTIKEFQRSMKEVTSPAHDEPALPPPAQSANVQVSAGPVATLATEDVAAVHEAVPADRQRE